MGHEANAVSYEQYQASEDCSAVEPSPYGTIRTSVTLGNSDKMNAAVLTIKAIAEMTVGTTHCQFRRKRSSKNCSVLGEAQKVSSGPIIKLPS